MTREHLTMPLAARSLMLMVVSAVLFSFSEHPGADSYTVFLNEQTLVEQYVMRGFTPRTVSIARGSAQDMLKVEYSHCGKIGVGRSIAIQAGDVPLKRWHFADNGNLQVPLTEVMALSTKGVPLQLVYFSRELPEGRVLVLLTMSDKSQAAGRPADS